MARPIQSPLAHVSRGFRPTAQRAIALLSATLFLGATAISAGAQVNSGSPTVESSPSTTENGDVIIDTTPQPGRPGSTIPGRTTPGNTLPPNRDNLAGTRFTCSVTSGQYTVMYQPQSQPGQMYPWAVPSAMGGGWDSARRCYEISRRLEAYRPDGLQEMQTAVENGYNTICVTTQRVPGCRIVLTVPRGQDPVITRDRVFQNLTIADTGQQTQGVNTFAEGNSGGNWLGQAARALGITLPGGLTSSDNSASSLSSGINLRPFLDRADGGTGTYLNRAAISQPGRRLNPNRFR